METGGILYEMMPPCTELPYLTVDLPGTSGVLRQTEDDFRVDERLAYEPTGEGDHVFARIEKRGLATPAAAKAMARALGVAERDVGWAGMKDKRAVTRQTLSFPPPCTPEAIAALDVPGVTVLSSTRHRHKLRTGHLRGNRFVLCVRDLSVDEHAGAERARAILAALACAPGSPNWFGAQRFGRNGDNAGIGRALIKNEPLPSGVRKPRGRQLRMYVSALQSSLFNEYLRERMNDGLFARVIDGDILKKRDSGGMFVCDAPAVDQVRLDAGEIVATGPMFGHKVDLPPENTAAGARECALLTRHTLTTGEFARMRKLGVGTRRPLAVAVDEIDVRPVDERAIEISFMLPAGAYATAVAREVVKGADPFPR